MRIFNCDAIVCVVDSRTYGMTYDQAVAFGDPPLNRGSALLTRCELACAQAQAKPVLPLLRLRQLPSHLPRALSLHHCSKSYRSHAEEIRNRDTLTKDAADAIRDAIRHCIDAAAQGSRQWDSEPPESDANAPASNTAESLSPSESVPPSTLLALEAVRGQPTARESASWDADSSPPPTQTGMAFPEIWLSKMEAQSALLDSALQRISALEAKDELRANAEQRIEQGLARMATPTF